MNLQVQLLDQFPSRGSREIPSKNDTKAFKAASHKGNKLVLLFFASNPSNLAPVIARFTKSFCIATQAAKSSLKVTLCQRPLETRSSEIFVVFGGKIPSTPTYDSFVAVYRIFNQ